LNPEDEHRALLQQLLSLEQEMHRTVVRRDRGRMQELLHPEFEEIGRSGRVYSRREILAEFNNEGNRRERSRIKAGVGPASAAQLCVLPSSNSQPATIPS